MIRIGILGYGRLGRAVELAAVESEIFDVAAVFTRRDVAEVRTIFSKVEKESNLEKYSDEIDVLVICHGSATDAHSDALRLCKSFNIVDTYDNHERMKEHINEVGRISKELRKTALLAMGWDPGLMSLMRGIFSAFMPYAGVSSFWGKGISQGHSQALRAIEGVIDAVQFTVPKQEEIEKAYNSGSVCKIRKGHKRVCFIAAEKGKEDDVINAVLGLENYFKGYEVEINFVDKKEVGEMKHQLFHRGRVIASGRCGENGAIHSATLNLRIGSNPDFTARIALAAALGCHRLYLKKCYGAYTIFDVPPRIFLSNKAEDYMDFL